MLEAQLAKEETNVYFHYPDEEEFSRACLTVTLKGEYH